MTSKQRQELSEITEEAIQNNDIETLSEIYSIIAEDFKLEPDPFAFEWFASMVDPDQWNEVVNRYEKKQ
jgi:hypothetical protein